MKSAPVTLILWKAKISLTGQTVDANYLDDFIRSINEKIISILIVVEFDYNFYIRLLVPRLRQW
jgi:hypothetical protein